MNKIIRRVLRPHSENHWGACEYVLDPEYAKDRNELIHSYHLIENDFKKLFDYIHFDERNKNIFSHRIYELILRSCTEFESNCKAILKANNYRSGRLNITDYFKINKSSNLNKYKVKLNLWYPEPKIIVPCKNWYSSDVQKLDWYDSYNQVKHDRNINFEKANLETLLESISGLLVILYSQFGDCTFFPYNDSPMMFAGTEYRNSPEGLFSISRPNVWNENQYYNLNWNDLKDLNIESKFEIYSY